MLVWKIFWINCQKKKSICSLIAPLSEPAGILNRLQQVAVVEVAAAAARATRATRARRPKNTTVERAEIPAVSVLVGNV